MAFEDLLGQRVLQLALDHPLQRPGAIDRIVAGISEPGTRCEYERGAVAWHLASSEAVTLRNGDSKVWCPNLLKKGVCATLGPVSEPYTVGFPKPAEFFGLLATGEYTLVECYGRTMLMCSWMTVLVGDPLYNPFKNASKLKSSDVVPSPKGGKNISP